MKVLQFLLLLTSLSLFFVDCSVLHRTEGNYWKPIVDLRGKKPNKESHHRPSHHLMGGKIGMSVLKPVTGPGAREKEKGVKP